MKGSYDSAYGERYYDGYERAEYHAPRRQGRGRIQFILAMLGLVSLGFMLWTIAQMLNVV